MSCEIRLLQLTSSFYRRPYFSGTKPNANLASDDLLTSLLWSLAAHLSFVLLMPSDIPGPRNVFDVGCMLYETKPTFNAVATIPSQDLHAALGICCNTRPCCLGVLRSEALRYQGFYCLFGSFDAVTPCLAVHMCAFICMCQCNCSFS